MTAPTRLGPPGPDDGPGLALCSAVGTAGSRPRRISRIESIRPQSLHGSPGLTVDVMAGGGSRKSGILMLCAHAATASAHASATIDAAAAVRQRGGGCPLGATSMALLRDALDEIGCR